MSHIEIGMTHDEELALTHMLSGDPLIGFYIQNQVKSGNMNPLRSMPVCTRCERPALYEGTYAQCPACGQRTPRNLTITVKQYMDQQLYK